MSQINTRDMVLLALTTATTNGTGAVLNIPQGFTGAICTLDVQTVSGTTPTLDVYVQNVLNVPAAADLVGGFPTGTQIFDDLLHFTQASTSTTRFMFRIVGAAFSVTGGGRAQNDAALAAGNQSSGDIGGNWRVKFVIGGTTPSFAFSAVAQFIP